MGEALRHRGRHVVGVELDPQLAALARARLDQVVEGDVERLAREGADVGAPFDCVVCADVLEHLRDPWSVVRWAAGLLTPEGCLVISVPNIRHAQTLWNLAVRRRWPYRDVGIFDRTHLRWFARANLADLLGDTGLAVTELRRSYLFTLNYGSRWNRLAKYCGDLGTLQFIFRAERDGSGGQRGSR
jgi:2-polyprenyl-3-methyl-5-hydroxy-6-metoxy-1,4-benzoquinol methylase